MSNCATLLGFGPYLKEDKSEYWTEWHMLRMLKGTIIELQRQEPNPIITAQLTLKKSMFLEQLQYLWDYAPNCLASEGLISEFTALRKSHFKEMPWNGHKWNARQQALHEDAKHEYATLLAGRTPSTVIRTEWDGDFFLSFEDALFWRTHPIDTLLELDDFATLVTSNPKMFTYHGITITNNSVCDMAWAWKSEIMHTLENCYAKWDTWSAQMLEIKNKNHKLTFNITSHDFFYGLDFFDEIQLFDT